MNKSITCPTLPFKVLGNLYATLGPLSSVVYVTVIGGGEESMFLLYFNQSQGALSWEDIYGIWNSPE